MEKEMVLAKLYVARGYYQSLLNEVRKYPRFYKESENGLKELSFVIEYLENQRIENQ